MSKKMMTAFALSILLFLAGSISVLSRPQPYFTFWGRAYVNGVALTKDDIGYTITLEVDGIELVRYSMGDNLQYGDYYVLEVPMDDDAAVTSKGQAGDTAYIYINGNAVDENPLTLGSYGVTTQKDIHATISDYEAEIEVSPLSLHYGEVLIDSSMTLSVTIENRGTAPLNVSSIDLVADMEFSQTSGPTSIELGPGASAMVEITYSPLVEGEYSGSLEITSDDADEPIVIVPLSGKGVAMASPRRKLIHRVNRAPVLSPIGNKIVYEDQLLQFTIIANDRDGDELTYTASNLPSGANFDPVTRTFTWIPTHQQAGMYYPKVHFEVSDGTLTDSEDITIGVRFH